MNQHEKALTVLDMLESRLATANTGANAAAIADMVIGTAQVHALLAIADAIEKAGQSHHFAAGSL